MRRRAVKVTCCFLFLCLSVQTQRSVMYEDTPSQDGNFDAVFVCGRGKNVSEFPPIPHS